MAKRGLTDEQILQTIQALKDCSGDRSAAGAILGIGAVSVGSRITVAKQRGLWPADMPDQLGKATNTVPDRVLQETVNASVQFGTISEAARSVGVNRRTFQDRLGMADQRGILATIGGRSDAGKPLKRDLPAPGEVKRYILSCAQNDTLLHEPTWRALHALADHYDAEVMVATLTYIKRQQGSAKRGSDLGEKDTNWYDPRIEPFVCDDMVALAPNLVWNGNMNILPTAVDPLSGMDNYNYRASSIFPHTKVAMKSIPTIQKDAAKLQYTTGAVTKRNYIQKKSGQKAEFDHVYGGLLVEVDSDGSWWARQLNVDSSGRLYDMDVVVNARGKVSASKGVEAIQFGDIHVAQLEDEQFHNTWGPGGMVDKLKPKYQFMHDILDFESRSHHNMRDPFKMFELHVTGRESVEAEIKGVSNLLFHAQRKGCELVIVQSNHDLHFERWLREGTWKTDPANALMHSRATTAFLEAIHAGEHFNALRWALDTFAPRPGLVWADPDEGFLILKDQSGGLEMGLHGDNGPNGARGSLRNLSRLGRKVCIGHSHSAGIFNGAWQSGVKAKLGMSYALGSPSSWTQTDIVVHPNGKRQMVTWWKGKYRA